MNILHVPLQIALLVEDLVADGAGEVVTLSGWCGCDGTGLLAGIYL